MNISYKLNRAILLSSLHFFLFCSCLFVHGQSLRTFYVGHSLSDQIPDMVQSLSSNHADVNFSWVYQSIPGAPLRWQWDRKDAMDYSIIDPNYYGFYDLDHGLPSGEFDVLVLTESVPRYEQIISETYDYADSFFVFASNYNPEIQIYLYEDWHCLLSNTPTGCDYDIDSNPWRQRLDDDLPMWESVVDTLNSRFNPTNPVCLIPAGQGLAKLYDSIYAGVVPDLTSIEDIFSDNIHLTDIGKYYIACIHFAMIHKTSPVGLTNQLQVWWGGDFDPPSEILALKFQELAWETVIEYPSTCLNQTTDANIFVESRALTILPNPSEDVFIIEGLLGNYTIQILDASATIYQTLTDSMERIEISLADLPNGLYFIKIENKANNEIVIQKILKQG